MARSSEAQSGGLTAAEVLSYLDTLTPPTRRVEHVRAYREAAAVLESIADLDNLRTGEPAPTGMAADLLEPDLIGTTGSAFHGAVMLRPEIRAEAIRRLIADGRVRSALDANPQERRGQLQSQLEAYLTDRPQRRARSLEWQTAAELESTLQVAVWLADVVEDVPEVAEVEARLDYFRLLAPFEALAGDDVFRGRQRELDRLRAYIGVVAPQSTATRLKGRVAQWVMPERQPAVSISGIGGAGKSSLVARFMLEHTRLPEQERIPFGYLDFARTSLDVGEPVGLCRELLRQLDLQFPSYHFSRGFGFLDDWRPTRADDAGPTSANDTLGPAMSVLTDILGMLRSRLGPRPYVIVLDTFEEIQYRGEERAFPLWELLSRMQDGAPFLRVVVAGRAPVESLKLADRPPRQISLGDLDVGAAAAFLETQGIADPPLQRDFTEAFGRMPLSLKLASSLAARTPGGAAALVGPGADGLSLTAASDEIIQARLYGRILDRIGDERIRRLAHPGLTLRRINPEIILNVLNEPCGLLIETIDDARTLFDELRRETSLVSVDTADGDLVHRPDLRRVMLTMMLNGAPAVTTEIHRRAVEWYRGHPGIRARAEYLYHRLHLEGYAALARDEGGERELHDRETRASLQAVIDEFPTEVQLWLATMGYQVPEAIRKQAGRDQDHAVLAAQIEGLLPYGDTATAEAARVFESAYAGLRDDYGAVRSLARSILGRVDWAASPLFRAGARIAAQSDDDQRALTLLDHGLERAARDGAGELTLGLLKDRAWLYRDRSPADQAEGLALLAEHARRHQDEAAFLQHLAQSIGTGPGRGVDFDPARLHELLGRADPFSAWSVLPALGRALAFATGWSRERKSFTLGTSDHRTTWSLFPFNRRYGARGFTAFAAPAVFAAPGPIGAIAALTLADPLKSLVGQPAAFRMAAFPAATQAALDSVLNALNPVPPAVFRQTNPQLAAFPAAEANAERAWFLHSLILLCEAWPYRVLYVAPPQGRRGEQLSVE